MFCLVAIIATKLKHFIEERNHRNNNQVQPFSNKEQKQPISLIANDVIQRKNRSGDKLNCRNRSEDKDNNARSKPSNTTIYNKNLIEVYHISFRIAYWKNNTPPILDLSLLSINIIKWLEVKVVGKLKRFMS